MLECLIALATRASEQASEGLTARPVGKRALRSQAER